VTRRAVIKQQEAQEQFTRRDEMHSSLVGISKAAAKWRKIDRAIKSKRRYLARTIFGDESGKFCEVSAIGRSEFIIRLSHEIRKKGSNVSLTAMVLFKNDITIIASYFVAYSATRNVWEESVYLGSRNDMSAEHISPAERATAKEIATKLGFITKDLVVPERQALRSIGRMIALVSKAEANAALDKRHRAQLARMGIRA
jgi:hypothetical protein